MTTPRVTVPVEAVELLKRHMPMLEAAATPTKSEVFVVCGHEAREMHDAIAMLSAAPAPEAGAVFDSLEAMAEAWSDRPEVQEMVSTNTAVFAKWADANLLSRFRQNVMGIVQQAFIEGAALATRDEAPDWIARSEAAWSENNSEKAPADHVSDARQMVEAPAEAGEPSLVDWFHQYVDRYVDETNGPDVEALIACLDRVRDSYRLEAALRAQPQARDERVCRICDGGPGNEGPCLCGEKAWGLSQAREDAQPVAWRFMQAYRAQWSYSDEKPGADWNDHIQPLYTHPAPDALRVAVEKLEIAKTTDDPAEVFMLAMEALTALQAEQGAK